MDQNKKFLWYVAAIAIVFLSYYIYHHKLESDRKSRVMTELKLEFENFKGKKPQELLDVNTSTEEMLLSRGISMRIAEKILDYRDTVGYIEKTSDLLRISGIGKMTVEKLDKLIEVRGEGKINAFNINKADSKMLKYYGFTKREIKRIEDWKMMNNEIYSNIELRKILGSERYEKYKGLIRYDDYDQ